MRTVFMLLLGAVLLPTSVLAHSGHDESAPAFEVKDVSPRAEARSGEFELLAVADRGQLIIFLDEFIGNEPISGAEIEVLADEELEPVVERAPGVYTVPWQPVPGRHELSIVVLARNLDDLLVLTIEIPDGEATADGEDGLVGLGWLSAIAIFLVGVLATLALAPPARGRRAAVAAMAIPSAVGAWVRGRSGRRDVDASPSAEATPAE